MAPFEDYVERRAEGRGLKRAFGEVATRAAHATGQWWAFTVAFFVVLAWLVTGPIFGFSDTWQLFINTATTIVTFLMVFLIQHAQNKDTRALQLKLNELLAAVEGASNRLIDIEELTDDELNVLHKRYQELAERAEQLRDGAATSVEKTSPQAKREAARRKQGS